MIKRKPHVLFTIALAVLSILTTVYYFSVPRFEYFGEGQWIHEQGDSLPKMGGSKQTVSNVYLLLKFTRYTVVGWIVFIVLYFIASEVRRLKFNEKYIWCHLVLVTIGFVLLTYLNPYIFSPQCASVYLSDVFIGGDLSNAQILQGNQLMLWHSSLETPTSITGIVLSMLGVVMFFVGLFRGRYTVGSDTAISHE